jgi:ribosomal protein L15
MQVFEHGAEVTIEHLKELGLVHHRADGYKVLVGDQEKMDRPMTIHATSFSAQARHEIHLAGGKAVKVYT